MNCSSIYRTTEIQFSQWFNLYVCLTKKHLFAKKLRLIDKLIAKKIQQEKNQVTMRIFYRRYHFFGRKMFNLSFTLAHVMRCIKKTVVYSMLLALHPMISIWKLALWISTFFYGGKKVHFYQTIECKMNIEVDIFIVLLISSLYIQLKIIQECLLLLIQAECLYYDTITVRFYCLKFETLEIEWGELRFW